MRRWRYSLLVGVSLATPSLGQEKLFTVDGFFGFRGISRVAACGDIDQDGTVDLVIGAPSDRAVAVVSGADGTFLLRPIQGLLSSALGESVDGAGDFDGDGTPDFVAGACNWNALFPQGGMVIVFSGRTAERLAMVPGAAAGDLFGLQVAGVGDVDQDGYDDVLAAGFYDEVQVLLGPDGTLHRTHAGDFTRPSLDGVGDVDLDGVPDYAIGWPQAQGARGKVTVFSGSTGAELYSVMGVAAGDHLGRSVAGVGDVDGDGTPDLLAGAPGEITPNFGQTWGYSRLYSGSDGSLLRELRSSSVDPDNFGDVVTGGGDVNGDGTPDCLIGSPNEGSFGAGYVVSGTTGAIPWKVEREDLVNDGPAFGRYLAIVGDLDGDGLAEFAHGDPKADYLVPSGGRITVFRGGRGDATRVCVTAPNSIGPGATIGALGQLSIGNHDLRLTVEGGVPNEFGFFFYGPEEVQLPVGDGTLCVGGGAVGHFRLDAVPIGAAGTVEYTVDFASQPVTAGPGAWTVGSVWIQQFGYRDPTGPQGTGFNFSDALKIQFTP